MTNLNGLTTNQVKELQKRYGKNELLIEHKNTLLHKIFHTICEPIFLLLITASTIYFFLGEAGDGIIMLAFVLGIICLDVLQEWKTDKTLSALKKLSQPLIQVIRDGVVVSITSIELVPGDAILVEEGSRIPADGFVINSHDFCLDESLLTGESGGVWKTQADLETVTKGLAELKTATKTSAELAIATIEYWREDYCYAGTMVTQGNATVLVDKIGLETAYGKIGVGIANAPRKLTPLQQQMNNLTKSCTWIAMLLFALVSIITYYNLSEYDWSDRIIHSLLSGVVLSLSMIPAEFPVILTVFLSMGALRLTKKHALIRKLPAVETLGAVSVICVDKTGTITKNQMAVTNAWKYQCNDEYLAKIAGMACDTTPYDPMEKAILHYCSNLGLSQERIFDGTFLKGYPFTQECKTMAHVWKKDDKIMIAAKGSSECLLESCELSPLERQQAEGEALRLSKKGLRVIAVAIMSVVCETEIPVTLQQCQFTLCGLIGLMDPPKESIEEDMKQCVEAGIRVVMITGDNGNTAAAIANQIHFPGNRTIITGSQITNMSDQELQEIIKQVSIFSRVIPEQKLRIVNAFQKNGDIVAMTGDGVNDAPALKYADIGIAMGLRGSEVTREAADLVLLDDNFTTIIDSIKDARRIYDNIRKAIGYVFTIHIPIALACLVGPLLHIIPNQLMLLPLHVVLLELIMNPTCSTALERQPAEINIMKHGPRKPKEKLLAIGTIIKSTVQGLAIFISSFGVYYCFLLYTESDSLARTIGLSALVFSNIFLILVNSSNTEYAYQSLRHLKKDKGIVLVGLATIVLLFLIIYSPLAKMLLLEHLSLKQVLLSFFIGFIFVFWYELIKVVKKHSSN